MLRELTIRNLAVIESVQLTFDAGFQVLTGETGAGKSIIIDALGLIAGGRASADLVRYGQDKAEMEALFDMDADHPVWQALERIGIAVDRSEPLMIRREVTVAGKSTSRINGQMVNQSMLREIGEWLVNIHGQHEHQSLLRPEGHIGWLDLFGGSAVAEASARYRESYERYSGLLRQLRELQDSGKQALQMQDLYRFQVEEIASAKLKPGEEEKLLEEKRKLANAEKLFSSINDSYEALASGKGLQAAGKAMQKLQDIAGLDSSVLQPLLEQIQSAYYQLEDASFQLRDYRDQIEFNPARIDQIERRLDVLSTLRRKYGDTVEEILQYYESIQRELSLLDNKDEHIRRLQTELEAEQQVLLDAAASLSALRRKAADELAGAIEQELQDLQMQRTRFAVRIETMEDANGPELEGRRIRLTASGMDDVEFLISANPGEPLRSISRIASGGELSRIMLAMKTIFAKVDRIPVLVFDEVDTGVSGRAAQAIAEKLSRLSADCQVFSITHLPQVACMADEHYLIQKGIEGERTYTRVFRLDHEGRVMELARMLGGVEVTETTKRHAEEMISMASRQKSP
ncbi:DNA repair protein RecN [Gorillibacterium timonense]|uniref:DNA repair protein RecN n=1 Tax=Gorillibacterium timonense TaxID=1689269 RepID=UPI00071CF5A0|nr:DNA repair protein RecN [Gorillibacterium timonense]